MLIAARDFPANDARGLIELARAQPGKLEFAVGGYGTSMHMSGELFKSMAHVEILNVPYSGSAPALADVMSGQVKLMFAPVKAAQEKAAQEKRAPFDRTQPIPIGGEHGRRRALAHQKLAPLRKDDTFTLLKGFSAGRSPTPRASGPRRRKLIDWQKPPLKVLDYSNPPFRKWFVGGETNLCYNAVDRHLVDARRPAGAGVDLDRGRPDAHASPTRSCTTR